MFLILSNCITGGRYAQARSTVKLQTVNVAMGKPGTKLEIIHLYIKIDYNQDAGDS